MSDMKLRWGDDWVTFQRELASTVRLFHRAKLSDEWELWLLGEEGNTMVAALRSMRPSLPIIKGPASELHFQDALSALYELLQEMPPKLEKSDPIKVQFGELEFELEQVRGSALGEYAGEVPELGLQVGVMRGANGYTACADVTHDGRAYTLETHTARATVEEAATLLWESIVDFTSFLKAHHG